MRAPLNDPDGEGDIANTRRCALCRVTKPLADFSYKNRTQGRRSSTCRDCSRAYGRAHYKRNRPAYLERARRGRERALEACRRLLLDHLRTHPCVDCGESDPVLLDFDHRDPSTKTANVAALVKRGGMKALVAEIAKCDIRCANDHRRKTARQFRWTRWVSSDG